MASQQLSKRFAKYRYFLSKDICNLKGIIPKNFISLGSGAHFGKNGEQTNKHTPLLHRIALLLLRRTRAGNWCNCPPRSFFRFKNVLQCHISGSQLLKFIRERMLINISLRSRNLLTLLCTYNPRARGSIQHREALCLGPYQELLIST